MSRPTHYSGASMTRSRILRAAAIPLLVAAALTLAPAPGTAAKKPSLMPYRGLGAWVDIYDDAGWDDPESTVAAMAAEGVRTLYLETCNFGCGKALFRPKRMDRFIDAAHAAGIRVVAWYLPGFEKPAQDYARSQKAIEFETDLGERFDSFALDIEAKHVPAAKRNRRLLNLSAKLRDLVGPSYPLGAITPPYFYIWGAEFPYGELAGHYDVFLPMAYSSVRVNGPRATHTDIVRNIKAIRTGTGIRNVPIHVIGGIADDLGKKETRAVVRAAREHGVLGASLYDYFTSSSEDWTQLAKAPVNPRQSPALPVKIGTPDAMGNLPADRSHPKEVFYRASGRAGKWKVRFEIFDAQAGEVALIVNWRKVADVKATPAKTWKRRTIEIPAKWIEDHRKNFIALVADGSFPAWTRWGVREAELLKA
jgi:hypothetical protein